MSAASSKGLRVIYRSVQEARQLEHFDFFILSDSDQPNQWIQEEVAWVELCKQVGGLGRIFYRKRRQAINRKSGNVADFLRRWGRNYRYMVVLDADSLMTGQTLVRLVG
jgi:membrane glycosyltransferase